MSVQLHVERLELRDLPAMFGTPWPDGRHLTISFAPDSTSILGTPANLSVAQVAPGSAAQLEILRAFQTWAVETNVNIGLVPDSGAAFGTRGAEQHDPRFGDIRIGGRPLASDALAITAPYQQFDAYSGNVILNTAVNFGAGGYDLYTVALQEAGHALGVGNSPDDSSAMYEYYLQARAALSAADVTSIRSLYGARRVDQFEGLFGNDTIATANPSMAGTIVADLTTRTDTDTYRFTAGSLGTGIAVKLRAAGLSLVTARVDILDNTGRVLATAYTTDPTRNDVTLSVGSVPSGQPYFVRVSAAQTDAFAVGSYELEVTPISTSANSGTDAQLAHLILPATGVERGLSAEPFAADQISTSGPSPAADIHRVPTGANYQTGTALCVGVIPAPTLTQGSVSPTMPASASFSLTQSGQVRLTLQATRAGGLVEAVVTDANGREWGRFVGNTNQQLSYDSFFSAGVYDVTVRSLSGTSLDFQLGMLIVTDPIGARPDDVSSAPAPATPIPQSNPSTSPPLILVAPPTPSKPVPIHPSTPSLGLALPPASGGQQLTGTSGFAQSKMTISPSVTLEYVWWY